MDAQTFERIFGRVKNHSELQNLKFFVHDINQVNNALASRDYYTAIKYRNPTNIAIDALKEDNFELFRLCCSLNMANSDELFYYIAYYGRLDYLAHLDLGPKYITSIGAMLMDYAYESEDTYRYAIAGLVARDYKYSKDEIAIFLDIMGNLTPYLEIVELLFYEFPTHDNVLHTVKILLELQPDLLEALSLVVDIYNRFGDINVLKYYDKPHIYRALAIKFGQEAISAISNLHPTGIPYIFDLVDYDVAKKHMSTEDIIKFACHFEMYDRLPEIPVKVEYRRNIDFYNNYTGIILGSYLMSHNIKLDIQILYYEDAIIRYFDFFTRGYLTQIIKDDTEDKYLFLISKDTIPITFGLAPQNLTIANNIYGTYIENIEQVVKVHPETFCTYIHTYSGLINFLIHEHPDLEYIDNKVMVSPKTIYFASEIDTITVNNFQQSNIKRINVSIDTVHLSNDLKQGRYLKSHKEYFDKAPFSFYRLVIFNNTPEVLQIYQQMFEFSYNDFLLIQAIGTEDKPEFVKFVIDESGERSAIVSCRILCVALSRLAHNIIKYMLYNYTFDLEFLEGAMLEYTISISEYSIDLLNKYGKFTTGEKYNFSETFINAVKDVDPLAYKQLQMYL